MEPSHFNPRSIQTTTFEGLENVVSTTFSIRSRDLSAKIKNFQLDAYFLTDNSRGKHAVRAYVQSKNFEDFDAVSKLKGGKYFGFCDIYIVSRIMILQQ